MKMVLLNFIGIYMTKTWVQKNVRIKCNMPICKNTTLSSVSSWCCHVMTCLSCQNLSPPLTGWCKKKIISKWRWKTAGCHPVHVQTLTQFYSRMGRGGAGIEKVMQGSREQDTAVCVSLCFVIINFKQRCGRSSNCPQNVLRETG